MTRSFSKLAFSSPSAGAFFGDVGDMVDKHKSHTARNRGWATPWSVHCCTASNAPRAFAANNDGRWVPRDLLVDPPLRFLESQRRHHATYVDAATISCAYAVTPTEGVVPLTALATAELNEPDPSFASFAIAASSPTENMDPPSPSAPVPPPGANRRHAPAFPPPFSRLRCRCHKPSQTSSSYQAP